MQASQTLADRLRLGASDAVAAAVLAIADAADDLAARIALGPLGGALDAGVGRNSDGDGQKALDVIADEAFAHALRGAPVRWMASEEQETAVALNPAGTLAVAIDPLDGSSNIDANISIGTIFSIYPAKDDAEASFLRPASEQIAAGYVVYGPQTALMLTTGAGTDLYILDRAAGAFLLAQAGVQLPRNSSEFAINASNYRHWQAPVRAYIDDCLDGAEGPRAKNFNMRWVASLVAETHRILMRGGVFLYPRDGRAGYERGRLRLVYECAPIAMLIAQAGGDGTDGEAPILGMTATGLHQRAPLVFGSADKVARIRAYHQTPAAEASPLFAERGLFRA